MKNKVYRLTKLGSLDDITEDFYVGETLLPELTDNFREKLIKLSIEEASSITSYSKDELTRHYEKALSRVYVYKNNLSEFKSIAILCNNSEGEFLLVLPHKYSPNYDIMINAEYWLTSRYKRILDNIDIFRIDMNEKIMAGSDSYNPELKYTFVKIGYEYSDSVSLPIPLKELDPSNPKSEECIKNLLKVVEENLKKVANNMRETNEILNK